MENPVHQCIVNFEDGKSTFFTNQTHIKLLLKASTPNVEGYQEVRREEVVELEGTAELESMKR